MWPPRVPLIPGSVSDSFLPSAPPSPCSGLCQWPPPSWSLSRPSFQIYASNPELSIHTPGVSSDFPPGANWTSQKEFLFPSPQVCILKPLRIIRSPFLPVWRLETGAALVFRVAPPGAPVSRQLCLCWSLVSRCSLPHSDRDHGPVTPGTRTASWPHTLPCVFSTFTSRISGGGDPWTPPSPHASSQCRRTGPTTDLRHPRPNPPL